MASDETRKPRLVDFAATDHQRAIVEAVEATSSHSEAAERVGTTRTAVKSAMGRVRHRAAKRGWSPSHDMTHPVPEGFRLQGTTTLYAGDGSIKHQYVMAREDSREAKLQALVDAMPDIVAPFKGASVLGQAPPPPSSLNHDLLAVYPMGDPHFGMFAWAAESGADFDLDIAERTLFQAVDHLVALAPFAEQALIVNLGDFFHSDTKDNRTLRSGHSLDVDTRWQKILSVGIRTMRRVIDRALERHKTVRVINEIGNHDDHTSIMLSLCLDAYYHNNPRVEIDTSPEPFHWYRFGDVLIGTTHGQTIKLPDLPQIMAALQPKNWGETRFRYWLTGHVHHDQLKEYRGCIVETFRTLAAKDSFTHKAGYHSGRDMKMDIYHRHRGRINRHVVGVEHLGS